MQEFNLNLIESDRLSFRGIEGEVQLTGVHQGKRLVFEDCENIRFIAKSHVYIESSSPEEAIIFQNPKNVELKGDMKIQMNKGVTIWGHCEGFKMTGVKIIMGHTGFRCNQPGQVYKGIVLEGNKIYGMSHEGIYIGTHYEQEEDEFKTQNVLITCNEISNCGWDGIQVGNTHEFHISNNHLVYCGNAKEYGHDFDVTVNPGSRGKFYQNSFQGKCQFHSTTFFNQ